MKKHLIALLTPLCVCYTAAQKPISRLDSLARNPVTEIDPDLPTLLLEEDPDDSEEEGGSRFISSILTAGRDPFLSAAAFNFSPVRFRLRGYESQGNAIYLNGLNFNGLDNGFTPFGLWGGLNNVMRAQQPAHGLQAQDFSIGGLALHTNVDMRAGTQRAQTQLSYALSNRNYRHRLAFSQASGFNKKGWAYSLAFTGRYAGEGYIPGTYYESGSYYMAIDKKINSRSLLSFISLGAPAETGRQGASVQETRDILGNNYYNPSWGWQNGTKRNANVLQTFQPVFLSVYELALSEKSNLSTTAAYVFGKRKTSALDWYNAPDPRPDYYRYLPSYYESNAPSIYQRLFSEYSTNPDALQIQWDRLYAANSGNIRTIDNANGVPGNRVEGKRSLYILSNRVVDTKRLLFNSLYHSSVNDLLTLTARMSFQQQVNHYYLEAKDLLGGDFWLNINQFAERDFPNNTEAIQFDLNQPNRLIKKGDPYGYNYKMRIQQALVWAQLQFRLSFFDLFVGGELSGTRFYREGLNRNGLFPLLSYGKSETQNFMNPAVKGGITYKLNGRNYFFINASYRTAAPFFENAYISQRTRNTVQEGLTSESFISGEAGYKLNAPHIRIGITGFYTKSAGGVDVLTFYHDQYQNFVNYALSGIQKIYFGVEAGAEIKLNPTLSFHTALSAGSYYYDSRQKAMVTVDNSAEILARQTVYLQNYRIPSTPQNAYSAGFFYRSPQYWYLSITANHFSNMWLSPNPIRRTADAIADADPANPAAEVVKKAILEQEKFDDQLTLDFFGGWNKLLPRKYFIRGRRTYLFGNLGISNFLNNEEILSGGFEQLRFDFEEKNVHKFPPKYYYAYGLNFFASIGFRF